MAPAWARFFAMIDHPPTPSSASAPPRPPTPAAPPAWALVAAAVAINVVWALSYPVSKLVMTDLPVGALSCWRVVGAALLLAPLLRRRDFPARWSLQDAVSLGLMGTLGFALPIWLQYAGTVRTTASNVSMIVGLETVMVVVLAALFLREPLRRRTWGGLAAAVGGVAFISVDPATLDLLSGRYAAGNGLMLLSIAGFASYTILGKSLIDRWSGTALTVLPLAVAGALMLPIFYLTDPAGFQRGLSLSGTEFWGVFFITAIATAASYAIWNWVLRWVSAGTLAYSLYIQPVAGALFSAWLLKETLTPTYWWGAGLILLAMALGAETGKPQPEPLPEEEPGGAPEPAAAA